MNKLITFIKVNIFRLKLIFRPSESIEELRYLHWREGWVQQHTPSKVAGLLNGVFPYKQVKSGNIRRSEGDVVIIGLEESPLGLNLEEYLGYMFGIDRIETKGLFTNIFWSKKFFSENLLHIINCKN